VAVDHVIRAREAFESVRVRVGVRIRVRFRVGVRDSVFILPNGLILTLTLTFKSF
jgi:hypothetical protein